VRRLSPPSVRRVIAETYPALIASIGVLQKCGFRSIGDGSEPGVIRFELLRDEHPVESARLSVASS
jgi:RimJ/RimL family protein N-acetyltransferase